MVEPDEDLDDPFEDLLAECLAAFECGGQEDLESLLSQHPLQAKRLRERVSGLLRVGLLSTAESDRGIPPEVLGDFVRGRRIGGGGMGDVYEAHQTSLGRKVALKMIRPDRLHLESARQRFRIEVETIARLHHPSIVPVYSVGEEQGHPFFAMELIDGCTLEQVISSLASKRAPRLRGCDLHAAIDKVMECSTQLPGSLDGSWEEICVRVVRDIAAALHHAHEQHVLHRDLKPSNVLITPDGRVLLFDFGLTVTQESARMTRDGALIGSPAYMAPELIREEPATVCSEVYSLGVTLYELLCLELPFLANTFTETQQQILDGDVVPPRHRNRSLSWDVETVCLKAMDRDPGRRYANISEFEADLNRVLTHESIVARPPSSFLRLRRWSQRHTATSVGLVLGTLLFVGGPTALWLQQREANVVIAAARQNAELNLETAIDAVDFFVREMGSDQLQFVPHLERLGESFVNEAMRFYDALLSIDERQASVTLRRKLAETHAIVAIAYRRLGHWDKAKDAALESVRRVTALLDAAPSDAVSLVVAVRCNQTLGLILRRFNELDACEQAYLAAVDFGTEIQSSDVHEPEMLWHLAKAYDGLGSLHATLANYETSNPFHSEAIKIFTELVAAHPGRSDGRYGLATTSLSFAVYLDKQGMTARASSLIDSARSQFEFLLEESPGFPSYSTGQAKALKLAAKHQLDGSALVQRSVEIYRTLVAEFPGALSYQAELADTLENLATRQAQAGNRQASLRSFEEARKLFEKLVEQDYGADIFFQFKYATCLRCIGNDRGIRGEHDAGASLLQEAITMVEPLVQSGPITADQRYVWSQLHSTLALIMLRKRDLVEAQSSFTKARRIQMRLATENPQQVYYRRTYANTLNNLGLLYRTQENEEEAETTFAEAEHEFKTLLTVTPDDPVLRHSLAGALFNRAASLLRLGQREAAILMFREAADHSLVAVRKSPKRSSFSKRHLDSLSALGRQAQYKGDFVAVMQRASEMQASNPLRRSCKLRAAALLANAIPDAEDSGVREELAERAMTLLEALASRGFQDSNLLKREPGLANLASEDGYAELMKKVVGAAIGK